MGNMTDSRGFRPVSLRFCLSLFFEESAIVLFIGISVFLFIGAFSLFRLFSYSFLFLPYVGLYVAVGT